MSSFKDRQQVALVIGGGIAGCVSSLGIRNCNRYVEIVLVEPKDYCEIAWASYRSMFDECVSHNSLCELQPFCSTHNITHIKETVKSLVGPKEALLSNGETLAFDVCVVCTGASLQFAGLDRGIDNSEKETSPITTISARKEEHKKYGQMILSNTHVTIVGGGLIGAELAGDVVVYGKEKMNTSVTIVHKGERLVGIEVSQKSSDLIKTQLEDLGVTVSLNESAIQMDDGTWSLSSNGNAIEGLVIPTTGLIPKHDFMNEKFSKSLNDKGFIASDSYFRVKGISGKHIYAVGDCCTTLPNDGSTLLEHIDIIGHNVCTKLTSLLKGEVYDDFVFKKANSPGEARKIIVTTGPYSGVLHSQYLTTKRVVPYVKNKSMGLFSVKQALGLKPSKK